jgi:hypothetical protein
MVPATALMLSIAALVSRSLLLLNVATRGAAVATAERSVTSAALLLLLLLVMAGVVDVPSASQETGSEKRSVSWNIGASAVGLAVRVRFCSSGGWKSRMTCKKR